MANLGYIQLLRICNQRCRFCSNPENMRVLPLDEARTQVDELGRLGYDGVIFTGGEPTLYGDLRAIVAHAASHGVAPRIITNGQDLSRGRLLRDLRDAGLRLMHVSLHSSRPEVQDALTQNPGSFDRIVRTLRKAGRLGVDADINTVINRYNAGHLDETVRCVVGRFPWIRHFVWNNIDPSMNRVAENPDTVAQPPEFEMSLHRAMTFLEATGRTFRVERVPLCFMADFAHCSTETRKIVKEEVRLVNFLDEKGQVRQIDFIHGKAGACRACRLDAVCAGLYEMGKWYSPACLHPIFLDPDAVRKKVK
ncbi:MAG: radical SAM protein [Deltaproteobacteria bacterium]|nr:radical SAM protein [Deltaproteobacteria bacterium]